MGDRNRLRAPAMERQISPKQILQRAKSLLTSRGKPTPAAQEVLKVVVQDPSPDTGTILRTKSLDDGNGKVGDSIKRGFLKATIVKSLSLRSDVRRNRKEGQSPPLPTVSTKSTSSTVSSPAEQPTTLVVPNLSGASISMVALAEKSSVADVAVPPLLREGVQMTKVSPGKQKSFKFQLDPDQGQIIWQSKKLRISTYF